MFSWREDIKGVLGIAAILALVVFAGFVQHWRDKARRLDLVQQEFTDYKALQARSNAASQGFQDELQKLRADVLRRPTPVVRLCPQSPAPVATIASGPAEAAPAAGLVQGSAGLPATQGADIGPGIAALLDRADEISAQLRAILTLEQ